MNLQQLKGMQRSKLERGTSSEHFHFWECFPALIFKGWDWDLNFPPILTPPCREKRLQKITIYNFRTIGELIKRANIHSFLRVLYLTTNSNHDLKMYYTCVPLSFLCINGHEIFRLGKTARKCNSFPRSSCYFVKRNEPQDKKMVKFWFLNQDLFLS